MLNRQENQGNNNQVVTLMDHKLQKARKEKMSIKEYLECKAFYFLDIDNFETRRKMSKTAMVLHEHLIIKMLRGGFQDSIAISINGLHTELDISRTSIREGLKELEKNKFFIIKDDGLKGQILYLNVSRNLNLDCTENVQSPVQKMYSTLDKKCTVTCTEVVQFDTSESIENTSGSDTPLESYIESNIENLSDLLGSSKENKTEIEIEAKKIDDDFLKKDDKKKIELFFPTAPEVEAEKQKEQEAYKKRFEELKRKLEAEKIKRDSEPKEIIVRNEQTELQNINNDETLENEKKVSRIENLTQKQQELRAFLIKDLEIDNPNFFFEYLNKIDIDNFTNTAKKLKEIIDNGKQINDKVSFLKKMIDNKLEKMNQESNGYNNSSNEYKINKNWESLFRYLNTKKLLNGKVVCGISLIDDVRNLNLNQDMFGIYIHELYYYGIISKTARKDLENELFEVLKIVSQWITTQEFKELIEWNSSTKHYARELIELYRGVL